MFDSDFVVEVVELQAVDIENLEADLVVESEFVDPEDTPRCCKLALSLSNIKIALDDDNDRRGEPKNP